MKLLTSTENKITIDKNGGNIPHLEITKVVFVHCTLLTKIISNIQKSCIHLFLINHLPNY